MRNLSAAGGGRRQSEAAAEAAVEVGKIIEAACEGDLADPLVPAPGEQIGCLAKPQLVQSLRLKAVLMIFERKMIRAG
jgi:hypothetical protein